jgi:hypothetical protein
LNSNWDSKIKKKPEKEKEKGKSETRSRAQFHSGGPLFLFFLHIRQPVLTPRQAQTTGSHSSAACPQPGATPALSLTGRGPLVISDPTVVTDHAGHTSNDPFFRASWTMPPTPHDQMLNTNLPSFHDTLSPILACARAKFLTECRLGGRLPSPLPIARCRCTRPIAPRWRTLPHLSGTTGYLCRGGKTTSDQGFLAGIIVLPQKRHTP